MTQSARHHERALLSATGRVQEGELWAQAADLPPGGGPQEAVGRRWRRLADGGSPDDVIITSYPDTVGPV